MKLNKYYYIIILFVFSLVLDTQALFALQIAEQESRIEMSENHNVNEEVQRRKKPKRKSSRSRRRKKKALDTELIEARAKVARERLLSGGVEPLRKEFQIPNCSELPLINRFKKGDRTLEMQHLKELYYAYTPIKLPQALKEQELKKLNLAIEYRNFKKALAICKQQIKFTPLNLTLLSKTCELAHHLEDESYQLYIWQLTELLYVISSSGDGKTDKTPYRLHSILDLLRFEELWLQTEKKAILEIKIHPQESGNLIKLFFKDKEEKRQVRYYKLV